MDEHDVRLRMTRLSGRFLQRARTDTAFLHEMIGRAHSSHTVTIDQLEHLAHRIHGSALTFGFAAVGNCAAEIEHLIEEFKLRTPTEAAMEPELRQRLLECARQLAREIDAAAAHQR
jgi:HPt (histidine-containing phosphotransfer) domain-containing protein